MGPAAEISRACSGVSPSRLRRQPMIVFSDMTSRSRSGSMGGFVTCAKSWLKYVYSSRGWSESTASAVSSPIEP